MLSEDSSELPGLIKTLRILLKNSLSLQIFKICVPAYFGEQQISYWHHFMTCMLSKDYLELLELKQIFRTLLKLYWTFRTPTS